MATTVIGLYDHVAQARAAVQELANEGFKRDDISLVANASAEEYGKYFDEEGHYREETTRDYPDDELTTGEGAASGAAIGGIIGGLGGLLMGLGLLAVPGVGPALAAGPIVSTLVGAGVGAAAGGLMGALVNNGVPEEEAGHYAEGVRRGGSLVMLTVEDDRAGRVESIMNNHDPVDIDERVAQWKKDGYAQHDPEAEPYSAEQVAEERRRYSDGDANYREHYESNFAGTAYAYEHYEPAYRFGTEMGRENTFRDKAWGTVQDDIRGRWEERNHGTWDDYSEAVRYGYERERAYA